MILSNILKMTDSYKTSHAVQYPPGTTKVYSYLESRGGEYRETVFFGLQYFLTRYLEGCVVTPERIADAKKFIDRHMGPGIFQEERWQYILEKHGGKLPVKICAVPEGTVIPTKNVLLTIENTDPNCYWLTNYLETLLVQVWYPSTTATISREMKRLINAALVKSGDPAGLNFKLHDFGYRGVSSPESAALGGAGHLVNFFGTDTMAALELLEEYYAPFDTLGATNMAGFSIPAAEHSTITSWGADGELAAFENMLDQFPTGLVAVVSDSWDIDNACKNLWGIKLKDKILARKGTLVIRPDSGEPTEVLPRLLNTLGSRFDCLTNDKGYRVLPPQVRLIQGDGIQRDTLAAILDSVMNAGWSADNLAFGSGGGLLQQCNRDTQKYAFKCSYMETGDKSRDVFKNPATAPWKASKKGRLALVKSDMLTTVHGTEWGTVNEHYLAYNQLTNELKPVFEDGYKLGTQNLGEIRARAAL